mgnify:CR=1 FL=1
MSALARWFLHMGKQVSGYDLSETEITNELIKEGAEVHYEDEPAKIPSIVKDHPERTLVIYTPALPSDHQELNYLRAEKYNIIKRSAALGMISKDHFTVAVAGTHGKTTTTTMIAHLLKAADVNFTAFMGGISQNYLTNLLINGEYKKDTIIVAEADEYDRSFLQLHPNIAVVTSADPDHLDIFGSTAEIQKAFGDFISQIDGNGSLVIKSGLEKELINNDNRPPRVISYSLDSAEVTTGSISVDRGTYVFDYLAREETIEPLELNVPGNHNVENALAAITVARLLQVPTHKIKEAIKAFGGVKRRFEYILKTTDLVIIDDYAHHPVELSGLIDTVKRLFPGKKVTAIFQPHLYTRTRDFATGFAESLDQADEVILLEIYPAREKPIQGVTSGLISSQIKSTQTTLVSKKSIFEVLKKGNFEVVVTIGAGDIAQMVEPIKDVLINRT